MSRARVEEATWKHLLCARQDSACYETFLQFNGVMQTFAWDGQNLGQGVLIPRFNLSWYP